MYVRMYVLLLSLELDSGGSIDNCTVLIGYQGFRSPNEDIMAKRSLFPFKPIIRHYNLHRVVLSSFYVV